MPDDFTPEEAVFLIKARRKLKGQEPPSAEAERIQLELEGVKARASAAAGRSTRNLLWAAGGSGGVTVVLVKLQEVISALANLVETVGVPL